MRVAQLFGHLEFDGDSYQIIAQSGPILALKSQTTRRVRHVSMADLLGDDSFEPQERPRNKGLADLATLDRLDDETRERTQWLLAHVEDILNAAAFGDAAPPLGARIEAKAHELASSERPLTARTLRKHVDNYRKQGVAGIVDGRKLRAQSPAGRQDARLLSLIELTADGYSDSSTGTVSRISNVAAARAHELGISVPSRATMYRLVKKATSGKHTFDDATTRRTNTNRPKRTYGRQTPFRPGELVEIDSTKLDLMVVFPDGSTGRPELTTMIDVATRTLTAAVLLPETTTGVDVAVRVLAQSLLPLEMQPGWRSEMALSRSILPAGMIISDPELHDHIAARPLIYPETITIDRGKVYTGAVFQRACERLQISVIPAPPATPTGKPHIERQFGSVATGFLQYLHGYTGRSTARRGKDPSKEAYWTLQQVQSLLDQWTVLEWQNRPRKALVLPGLPKKALTPNEMYTALSEVAPTPVVTLSRDDYISLLPVAWRTIQRYGINFQGLHYDCDAIHAFRGRASGLNGPEPGKWEVRYDPARMQEIYLRDHHSDRWVVVPWTLADRALAPFSKTVLDAALRATRAKNDVVSGSTVLSEIIRIQSGVEVTAHERKAQRRRAESSVPDANTRAMEITPSDAGRPSQRPDKPWLQDLPERLM